MNNKGGKLYLQSEEKFTKAGVFSKSSHPPRFSPLNCDDCPRLGIACVCADQITCKLKEG